MVEFYEIITLQWSSIQFQICAARDCFFKKLCYTGFTRVGDAFVVGEGFC